MDWILIALGVVVYLAIGFTCTFASQFITARNGGLRDGPALFLVWFWPVAMPLFLFFALGYWLVDASDDLADWYKFRYRSWKNSKKSKSKEV